MINEILKYILIPNSTEVKQTKQQKMGKEGEYKWDSSAERIGSKTR